MHAFVWGRMAPVAAVALVLTNFSAPTAWGAPKARATATQASPRARSFREPAFPGINAALAAARKGNPDAADYLANGYAEGYGVTKNASEAGRWWDAGTAIYRARAGRGDAKAMDILADRYADAYGRFADKKDKAESARWSKAAVAGYQAAAARGDASAMEELARRYSNGDGVEESEEAVAGWEHAAAIAYLKGAEAGNMKAMVRLAELYRTGSGPDEDDSGAAKWDRAAAAKGSTYAMLRLAADYDATNNAAEATRWTRMAADAGERGAMYRLALDYDIGRHGATKSAALATGWYQKAARQGHAAAIMALRDAHFRSAIANATARPAEADGHREGPGSRCTHFRDSGNMMFNDPPVVALELASARPSGSGTEAKLSAVAADPDGYTMLYTYSVTGGKVTGDGAQVTWMLTTPGTYTATVEADDGAGCVSSASLGYTSK
ncbi:MAG: hypothetical protein JWN69_1308 [Alphaproteobacteria bacterium]|nr:hypothetical protein [Alphaproteobacteria bacterium]